MRYRAPSHLYLTKGGSASDLKEVGYTFSIAIVLLRLC